MIYADDISKQILSSDTQVRMEVMKHMGAQSYINNKINSQFLASVVFSDKKKLNKLNSILHPKVRTKIEELSRKFFQTDKMIFVEAALIYESSMDEMFDYVVLISAEKTIRMMRSIKNKNFTEQDFLNRENNQIKEEIKQKKADFTFTNNGTKTELKEKASLLVKILELNLS